MHAVYDDSPAHVLAELARRVKALNPRALITSEIEPGDFRPLDEWGHDAQWADRSHHELHVLLTGEREGYYRRFGSVHELANDLAGRGRPPEKLVVCAQNHDQVGNRAAGDRLPPTRCGSPPRSRSSRRARRSSSWARSTASRTPSSSSPTTSTRSSPTRRARGAAGSSRRSRRSPARQVPDPQAEETFLRSKLSRREDPEHRALYERLLRLRRELPRELETHVEGNRLTMRRGRAELVADFDAKTVDLRA